MATTPRRKTIRPISRELLRKAAEDDPVAVFDQNGKLLGIVKPKDITAVSNPTSDEATAKKQPSPTRSAQTEAAAGEEPQMGAAKARAAALELKKALYTSATAEDQAKLATAMNVAAADVLKKIQARRPPRRG